MPGDKLADLELAALDASVVQHPLVQRLVQLVIAHVAEERGEDPDALPPIGEWTVP
jgi:hypothetical protein